MIIALLHSLCILLFAAVDAASLFGKVIEVNSGDVITIFNLNRPVRVSCSVSMRLRWTRRLAMSRGSIWRILFTTSQCWSSTRASLATSSLNGRVMLKASTLARK